MIMKTYDYKNVSKRHIQETLRTLDANKIFYLYHQLTGKPCDRFKVMEFIMDYAPTERIRKCAFSIACLSNKEWKIPCDAKLHNKVEYEQANKKQIAMAFLRKNLQMLNSPYVKRPILGYTHLYFASPIYGHSDYNKWCAMEIKGNEQFCNTIVALADKYFK